VEWKIQLPTQLEYIFGEPYLGVRLTAEFCTGAMFYIWRDKIILKSKYAFAAVFGALLSLTSPITVVLGLVLFGGYLVFWFALKFNSRWITGLGSKNDVSYGLYLYAFPIQNLLIWHFPGISPLIILLVTLPCSLFIGYVSWIVVEKPALKLKLLSKDISQTQTTQHPSNSRHTRAVPAGAATGERLGH
jgi:peptidoglycan/LPS O-acetylase OafA/YrhL